MEIEPAEEKSIISEIIASKPAKEKFLQVVGEKGTDDEVRQTCVEFIDQLQDEADARWPGPERDLWFNYHLSKTYAEAELWEYAQDAIEGLLLVAENMGQENQAFTELEQLILKKTS